MYIENPKLKGSNIFAAIPQKGTCPNGCEDCFFQSKRSYLEPLQKNLPNMPPVALVRNGVVRVNDGNDSNIQRRKVIKDCAKYPKKFYNTAIPENLAGFCDPVVLTVNPEDKTDIDFYGRFKEVELSKNLMFIRIRTNMWNLETVVDPAVKYFSENEIPIVLTFMAYHKRKIPKKYAEYYVFRKRTLNSYWAITTSAWEKVMKRYQYNRWVYSCGKIEGEKGVTGCRFCGNCLREYFATQARISDADDTTDKRWTNGTPVRTLKDGGSDDWDEGARDNCLWGAEGKTVDYSDAHGLCYQVKHVGQGVGLKAWYDRGELELVK